MSVATEEGKSQNCPSTSPQTKKGAKGYPNLGNIERGQKPTGSPHGRVKHLREGPKT